MRRLVTAGAVLAALSACGKRGDPLPPLPLTPQPVSGLQAAQRGGEVEVTLVAPRATSAGGRLGVLEVEILRATREGELGAAGEKEVVRAAPGERLVRTLPLPPPGTTLRLAARARSRGALSELTPVVTLTVREVPPAPPSLAAAPAPDGVRIEWTLPVLPSPSPEPAVSPPPEPAASPAPEESPVPAASPSPLPAPSPSPAGPSYLVYRRAPDEVYGAPLAAAVAVPPLVDTTPVPGESFCYVVRTAVSTQPLVESAPSPEACVTMADVAPPSPPAGLAALFREGAVELTWSPSPEVDLLAYRVYRAAPEEGAAERVAEVKAPAAAWQDVPPPGTWVYTLTAVDAQGNESPPSAGAEVVAR